MKHLCTALVLLASVAIADAKPSKSDLRKAKRFYLKGEKAYQLGDYTKALQLFERAYDLTEDPVVLLDVAQAIRMQYEQHGDPTQLPRARDLYRSFLREAPDSPLRGDVEGLLKKVEGQIASHGGQPRSGTDAVAAARRLAEQREYDQALAALDAALEAPNNTRQELVDIYKLRGIMLARRGREDDAQLAFKYLLAVDPGHRVAETSDESVIRAFAAARAFWAGKQPPALDVRIPARAEPEEAFAVSAKVRSDPLEMVADVHLLVRGQGQREYVRVKGTNVPGTWAAAPGVEIVVLGVDAHGGAVCAEGDLDKPLRVAVANGTGPPAAGPLTPHDITKEGPPPKDDEPWWKNEWVWGGAGAVVVGGVVAAILLSGGGSESCPALNCNDPVGTQ